MDPAKKRADRQARKQSEKLAKRDLDRVSGEAIDQALVAAAQVHEHGKVVAL